MGGMRWSWVFLVLAVGCSPDPVPSKTTIGPEPPETGAVAAVAERAEPEPEGPVTAPELTVGEDVTERFRAINRAPFAPPHTTFRPIATSPRAVPASRERAHGFSARFPSGAPVQTPTAHRGVLVVAGGFHSREMFAYREASGEALWGLSLGDDGPSNAACEDGVCVFNTESCTLFAVDVESGRMLWSHYLGDPLMSAPTIAGGRVFAAYPARPDSQEERTERPEGMSHALGAFDLHTGELTWSRWLDSDVISAPVAILDSVYVSTFAGTMVHFDSATGAIRAARDAEATTAPSWIEDALVFAQRLPGQERAGVSESIARSSSQATWRGQRRVQSSVVRAARYLDSDFQQGTQYASQSANLDAMNGFAGGAPSSANAGIALGRLGRGSVRGLQEFQGSWVLGVGELNVASMGDEVVAFDRETGEQRWTYDLPGNLAQTGGSLAAPPALAGEHVIVATHAGQILLLDPTTGVLERSFEVGAPVRTQPIASGGWIYVGTTDGQLVGIRTGDPSVDGWTTWAGNSQRTGRPG